MTEYKTFNRKVFDSKNADTPEPLFSDEAKMVKFSPEFIVRAVNCHEELIETLESLADICKPTGLIKAKIDHLIKRARGE